MHACLMIGETFLQETLLQPWIVWRPRYSCGGGGKKHKQDDGGKCQRNETNIEYKINRFLDSNASRLG